MLNACESPDGRSNLPKAARSGESPKRSHTLVKYPPQTLFSIVFSLGRKLLLSLFIALSLAHKATTATISEMAASAWPSVEATTWLEVAKYRGWSLSLS